MKKPIQPVDTSRFIRIFHLHCFLQMFRIWGSQNAAQHFSLPRFKLFQPIKKFYQTNQTSNVLFKNILYTFQNEFIIGSIITIIFASCNLLVPQLIKSFLNFMHQSHVKKSQVLTAQNFIQYFFIVQFLRIIFGEHSKRIFNQLAIQIQSSLSKKLIRKALSMQYGQRNKIPKSEIMQLENVDLKLIFNMFKNFYLVIQAPFTIIVAIILLFREDQKYGFIGIYWFIIAFLIQRQLDSKMKNCNQTKLKLIDQRSKINYELFNKIEQAKIIHFDEILIEKNNDLFILENHDHYLYYNYSTLYDITLLILPIIVVVTISMFDSDNVDNHITVSQVFVILQLLGICYNPMKSFRNITINLHDGLHSMKRIEEFFQIPDQKIQNITNNALDHGQIVIQQNTVFKYKQNQIGFYLHINHHIQIKPGNRLIVLGKKGQGKSSFLKMFLGLLQKIQGNIFANGKITYALQNQFLKKGTILQNIIFTSEPDKRISSKKQQEQYEYKIIIAQKLFKRLGFESEFNFQNGIHQIIEQKKLTKGQKKKIVLARALLSESDILLFENIFECFDKQSYKPIQKQFREIQTQKNKTIILAELSLQFAKPTDYILILQNGESQQFGTFNSLLKNPYSHVSNFFKSKYDKQNLHKEPESARKTMAKFISRVSFAQNYTYDESTELQLLSPSIRNKLIKTNSILSHGSKIKTSSQVDVLSKKTTLNIKKRRRPVDNSLQFKQFWKYFGYYFRSVSKFELMFVLVIIAVAEFLHIFIHFYLGHLGDQLADNPYIEFRNVLILQFILTLALASIIYFEGEVSSLICIIQGNNLYSQSLTKVVKKPIQWFKNQFSVKVADKFNHDYEEIFIIFHMLLGIYKNLVILIFTIYVVSSDKFQLIVTIVFISIIYINIGSFLRKIKRKVIYHYYDYKYQFVKIFQECLEGGVTIRVFNAKNDFIQRAEKIYKQVAAYKLSESYTSHGQEIFCDTMSLIILMVAFTYGFQMKTSGKTYSTALVGTGIHLLLNVSEVLKGLVKLSINFETFFNINIVPFLQASQQSKNQQQQKLISSIFSFAIQLKRGSFINQSKKSKNFSSSHISQCFDIKFQNVVLIKQATYNSLDPPEPLNLQINQSDRIFIYEKDQKNRKLLVYALTKNYDRLSNLTNKNGKITLGGINLRNISDKNMLQCVSVITSKNFFFNGTLRENLTWKWNQLTKKQEDYMIRNANRLFLYEDIKEFHTKYLDSKVQSIIGIKNYEFSKKISVLRILLRKPKIVILENTSSYIDQESIVDIIKAQNPETTIIKITDNIGQIQGCSKVIYLQNLKIFEQGPIQYFKNNPISPIGQMLYQFDEQNYKYQNKACSPTRINRSNMKRSSESKSSLGTPRVI